MQATGDSSSRFDYEAQIADGFRLLRFRRALETEFRHYRRDRNMGQLRAMLWLGFIFGLCFVALDYFLGEIGFSDNGVWQRTAISHPLILAMIGATYLPVLRPWLGPMGIVLGVSIAASSMFLGSVAQLQNIGTAFTGVLILTFYVYLFIGLRFWPALLTAVSILAMVIITYMMRGAPAATLIYNTVFLAFANVIGATGLYNLEYNQRLSFLEARILEKVASLDHLTGLVNREHFDRYFDGMWRHCLRTKEPLSVALLDIDHFKNYNDTYGHQAGDECLRKVAQEIANACRRPLDMAARYGGEEFVLILPGARADHAHLTLSQVVSHVEALNIEHRNSDTAPRVTISAGVAQLTPHETEHSPQGLLQLADEALYTAKSKGRNRVVVAREDREESLLTGIFSRSVDGRLQRTA
ncbi:MAG: GGDEF domain-containing protein [Gammaproteobacteria bacterium]|nr:GGDEF domain-containing protein [Gammaproteobacteria bacterium]